MPHQSNDERNKYRASCTHYRKGHVVCEVDGTVVFDGSKNLSDWDRENGVIGVNAAKRHVKEKNLRSFTIRN